MLFETLVGVGLGLAGSLHCLGMCGPLAFGVVNANSTSFTQRLSRAATYHLGRSATYALFGLLVAQISDLFILPAFSKAFSVFCAVLVLAVYFLKRKNYLLLHFPRLQQKLNAAMAKALAHEHRFLFGCLNALLPCGLLYAALAAAASLKHPLASAGFMFFFGLGTLPMMLLPTFVSGKFAAGLKHKFKYAGPTMVGLCAALLIARAFAPEAFCLHKTKDAVATTHCYAPR